MCTAIPARHRFILARPSFPSTTRNTTSIFNTRYPNQAGFQRPANVHPWSVLDRVLTRLTLINWTEMLGSLHNEEINARLTDIAPPYGDTFSWIWTADDLAFVSWLQSGAGIYWISGKPGSGKSTLMKYLYCSK